MSEIKIAPLMPTLPAAAPAEPEFKPYIPEGLGMDDCAHCGLSFDLEETRGCNPFKEPHCGECLDIYFAAYEPPDQVY